jgi:transposase InsO family protein
VPWKETRPVEQRFEFVIACEKQEESMAQICRQFGVSRQTGYKWLRRYRENPEPMTLDDLSRKPTHCPQETGQGVVDAVVDARRRYPHWGPRKLKVWLGKQLPAVRWPATSTIGEILRRQGLTRPPRRRLRTPPYTKPFAEVTAPNQLWCIDFKGQFNTQDGARVYPLTITDAFSRFLLCCEIVLDPNTAEVRTIMEAIFSAYGLPEAIRSDNGPPFASTGPAGLSELSVWWTKLGIRHERIEPGKPQQNGRHERMHLTLKREAASPPSATARGQQGAFNRFRLEFNHDRPHEGIGFATPDSLYAPSAKPFPKSLARMDYPFHVERALVTKSGTASWQGRPIFIGAALRNELVEFRPAGRRRWTVCFGPVVLGAYDPRKKKNGLIRLRSPRKHRISNGVGDALRAFSGDGRKTARPQKSPRRLTPPSPVKIGFRTKKGGKKKGARVSTMSPV